MAFYYFTPSDDSDEGESSESVSDAWSEMEEEGNSRHVSKEAQEAVVQEQFKEAMEALRNGNQQKLLRIFTDIFLSAPMHEFYVENWRDFNWEAATEKSQRNLSNMAKVYFSVCIGLAGLVENPVAFYMQALSIYPKLTDVWFACGKEAAKADDWATAELCFDHCGDEFRALEALLLLHYINDDLHKCVGRLQKIFDRCDNHFLANFVCSEMIARDVFWRDTFASLRLQPGPLPDGIREKISTKINDFRTSKTTVEKDGLMELIMSTKKLYAPFALVLQRDTKMEDLGRLLCDAFARIEMFSSIAEQLIYVEESTSNVAATSVEESMEAIVDEQATVNEAPDSLELSEECAVLNGILDAVCLEIEQEEEAKRKRQQKKKVAQQRCKYTKNDVVDGLLNDEEFARRRSTRFVEDVESNSANDDVAKVTLFWTYMSVNDDTVEKMLPFVFASSADSGKSVFSSSSSASILTPLPSFEALIAKFLTHSKFNPTRIERLLVDYLLFCADSAGVCDGCAFSEEQSQVYRKVYASWYRAFTDNVFCRISNEELHIHTLAAELGSPLAFSILRTHFSSTLKPRDVPLVSVSVQEKRVRRTLFNRYLWLLCHCDGEALGFAANAPEFIVFRFAKLTLLTQTLGVDERIHLRRLPAMSPNSKGDIKAETSVMDVSSILYNEARNLYAKQVNQLQEMEEYEELFFVLSNHYNFSQDVEEVQLDRIFLLIKCAIKTNRSEFALSSILALLQKVRSKLLSSLSRSKLALRRCVEFLESIDLEVIDSRVVCAFGKSLAEMILLSDNELLHGCVNLWAVCYRIAKVREVISMEALDALYSQSTDNSMPTRALMVLTYAHDVVGRLHRCWKQQGMLLRLFLEEMHVVMSNSIVRQQIAAYQETGVAIIRNVALEAFQCLTCVFSESLMKIRNHYDDHGNAGHFDWECDWQFAEIVLPLIMPRVLPEFSSLEKISSYFSEVLMRVFPFVLDVSSEALSRLQKFFSNPPSIELKEVFDEDGLTSHFSEEFVIEGTDDPRTILYGADFQQPTLLDERANNRLYLASKCLYLLSIYHYRNNNSDEALRMVRNCLAICGSFLNDGLQSSAWFVYARCVTNDYSMLQDADLLKSVDEFLLPFKMTIFLKKDSSDAHLDLAEIIYQIRTRMKRFTQKSSITEEQKRVYHQKIEGMIPKCRTHFELAKRYNDSDAEIPWLSSYFLAKIAEKLGDQPNRVYKWYYESALAMENEGYQYPQKINRSKQTNFEPLEIHYKVHAFAYKQLMLLDMKHTSARYFDRDLQMMRCLLVNLQRFSFQAVEQKGVSKPEFYVYDDDRLLTEFDVAKADNVVTVRDNVDSAVENLVSDMVDFAELKQSIFELCEQGFETILSKFPHYKACYRIAEAQYIRRNYRECADTLFHRLFFNVKKRLTSASNIFENIVEISRADIERSGSFPYHITKIIDLAIVSSFKSHEVDRLVTILHSLLTLKNRDNVPDMLDELTVSGLRYKCITGIIGVMATLKTSQSISQGCFQLSELTRKMNRDGLTEHAKLLESTHQKLLQRRAALEQQKFNQQRIQLLQQQAMAQKRSAVENTATAAASDRCSSFSPTSAKQPRLLGTPTLASALNMSQSSQRPITSITTSAVYTPTTSTAQERNVVGGTQAFADFLDNQLKRLPPAERQRFMTELQKAASRTDMATQKTLMMKFVEKICVMAQNPSQQRNHQEPIREVNVQRNQQSRVSVQSPSFPSQSLKPVGAQQQQQALRPSMTSQVQTSKSSTITQQYPKDEEASESVSSQSLNKQHNSLLATDIYQNKTSEQTWNQQHVQRQTPVEHALKSAGPTKPQITKSILSQQNQSTKFGGVEQLNQPMSASFQQQISKHGESSQNQSTANTSSTMLIGIQQHQISKSNVPRNTPPVSLLNNQQNKVPSNMTVRQHLQQISGKKPQTFITNQQSQRPPVVSTLSHPHVTSSISTQQAKPVQAPSKNLDASSSTATLYAPRMSSNHTVSTVLSNLPNMYSSQAINKNQEVPVLTSTSNIPSVSSTQLKSINQSTSTTATSITSTMNANNPQLQLLQLKQQLQALARQNSSLSNIKNNLSQQNPPQSSPLKLPEHPIVSAAKQIVAQSRYSLPSSSIHSIATTAITSSLTHNIPPTRIPPATSSVQQRYQSTLNATSTSSSYSSATTMSSSAAMQTLGKKDLPQQSWPANQQPINTIATTMAASGQQKWSNNNALPNINVNMLTPQQQYMYNLYMAGLQRETERVNKTYISPVNPSNQADRKRRSSDDDIIVVSQKGPSVKSGQGVNAPVSANDHFSTTIHRSPLTTNTSNPIQQPPLRNQVDSNNWTEHLKKLLSKNPSQPHQQ